MFKSYNCYRTLFILYPLGLMRAVSLLANAEVACPALSLSYSRINSKSCVTDSPTKGDLKCQDDSSRTTQLWILSCKILTVGSYCLQQGSEAVQQFWETYKLCSCIFTFETVGHRLGVV